MRGWKIGLVLHCSRPRGILCVRLSCKTSQLISPVFPIPSLLSFDSCVCAMFIHLWIFILRDGMRILRISMTGTHYCCRKVCLKCWRVAFRLGTLAWGTPVGFFSAQLAGKAKLPPAPQSLPKHPRILMCKDNCFSTCRTPPLEKVPSPGHW